MGRLILHLDTDAFFAAVERIRHPDLWGRTVVVAANGAPMNRVGHVNQALALRRTWPSSKSSRMTGFGRYQLTMRAGAMYDPCHKQDYSDLRLRPFQLNWDKFSLPARVRA